MDGASQSLCDESEPGDICEVSKKHGICMNL